MRLIEKAKLTFGKNNFIIKLFIILQNKTQIFTFIYLFFHYYLRHAKNVFFEILRISTIM